MDVKTAFLHSSMNKIIHAKPTNDLRRLIHELMPMVDRSKRPYLRNMIKQIDSGCVLRLKKSLFGTKQAPRKFNM
jgi:hypothetical protein